MRNDPLRARPRRLVHDGLIEAATLHPTKEAVVTADERIDYATLLARAEVLACELRDAGVTAGDRVTILLENSVDSAVAVYGVWLAGGVLTVVNPQTKTDKLAYLLDDSGARAVISHPSFERVLTGALAKVEPRPTVIYRAAGGNGTIDETKRRSLPRPSCLATDLAALIYTSGSTGEPKGVMVTHQNIVFSIGALVEFIRLDEDDRILSVLPLAFNYGLYQLFMTISLGATLILETGFAYPALTERRIREEGATVFPGVPTIFATLANRRTDDPAVFPTVRRVTNTAAALAPGLLTQLEAMFPNALFFLMYGLTECKRVCGLEPELMHERPESVGKAMPGTEAFLLDANGDPVPPGGVGILHARGPHVMVGYWNKPEQTAHMLRPGHHAADRVLCTHDVFRMDEDGFLYFQGRSDDIIKSRGEKVSPVEVENVLYSLQGVREAAVIGVPDEVLGQAVRAYVSLTSDSTLDERSIRRACQERLEAYMVPREVVILADLPKTDTGKIRKAGLVGRLSSPEGALAAAEPPQASTAGLHELETDNQPRDRELI
jgi:long-chain acyl-CoA synthetase